MSKSTKTTSENKPPKWAEPLLKEGAQAGLDLYKRGVGFNPYEGETRAGFSDVSLGAMNNGLAATGYTGAPVTNDMWRNTDAVKSAMAEIQRLKTLKAQQNQDAANKNANGKGIWIQQNYRGGKDGNDRTIWVNTVTGETSKFKPASDGKVQNDPFAAIKALGGAK